MLKLEISGTVIEIRASFFLVIAFMLTLCEGKTVLISLFSSLFHECGHIFALAFFGEGIDRLLFSASGLRIDRGQSSRLSLEKELFVALSGVFVNVCVAAAAYIIYRLKGFPTALSVTGVNLVIALFNLLPIESLDGARGLNCFLCRRIPEERVDEVIADVSVVTTALLIVFFGVTVYMKAVNPSLVIVIIYLVILLLNRIYQLKKSEI